MTLRRIALPDSIPGSFFLDSMPGRYESFDVALQEISRSGITRVVCLAPLDEVIEKSPHYAMAIQIGSLPWQHEIFPVVDHGAPEDCPAFWRVARTTAAGLLDGERVLAHCAAGIGRTGMFAICVLIALGIGHETAESAVRDVGSGPESESQDEAIRRIVDAYAPGAK